MFRSSNVLTAEPAVTATSSILAGLTPAQAEATSLSGAVLVLAGAGTGKTKTLTSGVAWRIEARGIPASRILAVTFTNKAAGEMTERIRRMLAGQEVPSWCGTFHGLSARQLRAEPEVAGDRVKRGLSLLDQLSSLQARHEAFSSARREKPTDRSRLGVSSTATHEFAQMVSKVLTAWQFPGNRHVSSDEETFDLKIDGKRRRDNGKGVRAITHAAFKVALLLHCREKNLPHPGFLVLDTPLLTYRDPLTSKYGDLTGDEQEIASMSLKDHFFEHLAAEAHGAQFIVLENVDPPTNIGNLEVFHGNRGGGRFGLFPA